MTNALRLILLFKAVLLVFTLMTIEVLWEQKASADEILFVQPAQGALRSAPKMDASVVLDLARGDEVSVIKKEGMWYQVKKSGKAGWVPKLFVNANKPIGASTLSSDVKNDFKASRERNTPRSVVASTRGLDSSRSMSRVREGGMIYRMDFRSVDDLEKYELNQDELATFQKQLGTK